MKKILIYAMFLFVWNMAPITAQTQKEIAKLVIDYQFDAASNFSEGLALVQKDGKFGFIDKTGKLVIDYQFDAANSFNEGLAVVQKNGKIGCIDKTRKLVSDYQFDGANNFNEGLALVQKDGKMGFIDKTGKSVTDCQFDGASNFKEGLAPVKKDEKWGYIDKTGKLVIDCQFDVANDFNEGLAPIYKNKKFGYIDKTGNLVIKYQFDAVGLFSEGLVQVMKNKKFGYIDKTGNLVIKYQFDDVGQFNEGLAPVKKDEEWGYIDKTGKLVINYQFGVIGLFSEGLAPVAKKERIDAFDFFYKTGKLGYIDKTGKLVIDYQFDTGYNFIEGLALVKKDEKWGFIDKTGKVIIDYQFDAVEVFFKEGLTRVMKDGKWGYIDKTGKVVINCQFDQANDFNEGLALVAKDGKLGYIARYTLTDRIKEYVELSILQWQKKGEFEKMEDYTLRVNEQARNAKVEELTAEAIAYIKKEYMQTILSTDISLKEYDADNEVYLISSNSLGNFTIPVPLADAPSFKQNFEQAKFEDYDFSIADDAFQLARLTIRNPANGKKYYYDSKQPVTYVASNIVYNFPPIEIEVDLPKGTPQPKTTPIESKTTVVGLPDVDVNIPVSSKSNPHAYALIIGNEDYKSYQSGLDNEVNVAFAENDARIFEKYCTSALGIPKSNVRLLINATSGQMQQAIEWINKLIEKEEGKAEVIVYYAGHGLPDEQSSEPYIIPVDVSSANLQSAVKLQDMYAGLTKYPSRKITVFMDACFTGGGREQGLLAARGVKIKPKEEVLAGNIVVFTSSSGEQSSLPYKDKQHGMFTYHLLKKIQETSGNISYNDLYNVLRKTVDLESVKHNQKEQTPSLLYPPDLGDKWKEWKLK